jgi:hypothetical protein
VTPQAHEAVEDKPVSSEAAGIWPVNLLDEKLSAV